MCIETTASLRMYAKRNGIALVLPYQSSQRTWPTRSAGVRSGTNATPTSCWRVAPSPKFRLSRLAPGLSPATTVPSRRDSDDPFHE